MKKKASCLALPVAVAIGATLAASSTFAQSVDTARIEAGGQNDWLTYHGSYKSYHYSPLAQINASNVANLQRRLDPHSGTIDPRPAVDAARGRRRALLHGLLQPDLCAERRHRRGDLVLFPGARRSADRPADALALQSRRRARRGQGLCRHDGRPADRARHEDRQGRLGHQADQFPEADRRLHRRAALRQGHGGHRRAGRRMAGPRPDLRRRRRDRQEEMGVPHRRRHRRGHEDLGQRLLAHRRRRRLDAGHLQLRDQHDLLGHRQSGAALRLVGRRLARRRARARATISIPPR